MKMIFQKPTRDCQFAPRDFPGLRPQSLYKRYHFRQSGWLILLAWFALASLASAQTDTNVKARLIASHTTIVPGEPFTLGLELTIDPTWHTYWINPGETGKTTTLQLDLPGGFTAGKLGYPVPKRFVTDYGYDIKEAGFGYTDVVIHPITITPPSDLKPGTSVTLKGEAEWLMCDPNTCLPGQADLSITLSVGSEAVRSTEADAIASSQKKLPESVNWPVAIKLQEENLIVSVDVPEGALADESKLHLYPYQSMVFDQLSEPKIVREGDKVQFTFAKHADLTAAPESFAALLVEEQSSGKKGWKVSTGGEVESEQAATVNQPAVNSATPADSGALPFGGGLIGILLAAFLGGITLNIMPCVFPVISLKVMSFVAQAGEDRKKVLAHSLVFALGILIFFWILTTMLLLLRSGGNGEVGWGVQLQQPGFVIVLIFVMVAVAMSLFGIFEIGTSLTSVGGSIASKSGYTGSFWSGALAVLLATPCTAPLMAPAIGFALSQSAPIMFLVFTALGLGLAAPYFVFAAFPKLLDVVPAPGPWMETFKQFMGFPMLAVAIWLIGVLSRQLSVSGLQWALGAVLLLAVAGWIYGRFGGFERSVPARLKGRGVALVFAVAAFVIAWDASAQRAPASSIDIRDVIARHQQEGKHVFVDFTAEWCVTCKVNERTTIKTQKVQDLFAENNIAFVVADWTNEDPSITKELQKFGRAGVPFYALYPSDPTKNPVTLGDGIVTMGAIKEAIEELPN